MSFTSAQTIPYHPSQCPQCKLLVGGDRCKGFVTKDPLGDMLGTFKGESNDPCPKFVPTVASSTMLKTDQQEEETTEIKCAKCNKNFVWDEAHNQQDTPGSSSHNPPGHGEFRPRGFCPHCGFMVAEWDIDQKEDRNRWKWHDRNENSNRGKDLPPNPITLWGKSIPLEVRVSVSAEQIDLSKMQEGASNDKFFNAAASGAVETVRQQILAGADINTKSYKGETAVMMAAMEGHTEVVKTLIEAGVDINDQNVYGKHTPLILASLNGHLETVKVLLESGADPNLKNQFGKTAEESAKTASHSDVVNWLANANKNERDEKPFLEGFCDLCGDPDSQLITVSSVVFRAYLDKGFNPYKTPGIDMSRSIQMSRALGTAAKFNDEEELKEALFQNWKKLASENFTDWALCHKCSDAYNKAINKSGRCFIATAAFSSPFSDEVTALRNYRDEVLIKTIIGRIFVSFYYLVSPSIASKISKSVKLKTIARWFLFPFVKYCKYKNGRTIE